jgi:hypothetical protein
MQQLILNMEYLLDVTFDRDRPIDLEMSRHYIYKIYRIHC